MSNEVLELKLKRLYKNDGYTIGKLFVNCKYFCDTLEDEDRELSSCMELQEIQQKKVNGATAIPTGLYEIVQDIVSPKYSQHQWYFDNFDGGKVPRLLAVKGFSGILIHSGNYANDTDGCILVGENKVKGGLINSKLTLLKLRDVLRKFSKVLITIE